MGITLRDASRTPSNNADSNKGAALTYNDMDDNWFHLYGITAGTALANKAMIPTTGPDISGIRNLGWTGTATGGAVSCSNMTSSALTTISQLKFSITAHGTQTTSFAINWNIGNFMRTMTLGAGAFTFSATTNAAAGDVIEMYITGDASGNNLTFPAGWTFVGYKPSSIAAGATAVLSLRSYGTDDSTVVAAWAEE